MSYVLLFLGGGGVAMRSRLAGIHLWGTVQYSRVLSFNHRAEPGGQGRHVFFTVL